MKVRRLTAAIISIFIARLEGPALKAQTTSIEGQVKAAFLFKFAQFIQWPSHAFADREMPFTMCAMGDPFEGALEKTVEQEMLNGRRIAVRRLSAPDNIRGCHVVYIGRLEARRSMEIIAVVNQAYASESMPILTVGDSDDFINAGGMIRFTEVGQRVRFEINPDAAERVSLRISSRLLRVADIARPRSRAGTP